MTDTSPSGSLWFAELHYLRLHAVDLLETCLTDGVTEPLERFIDQQISEEPPRLDLLREIADEISQRLQSLRESHFTVRDQTIRTLVDSFGIDLGPVIPLRDLNTYHLLDIDVVLCCLPPAFALTADDEMLLRHILGASLVIAEQIHRELSLLDRLHRYLIDWLTGLNAVTARRAWGNPGSASTPQERIH